MTAGEEKEDTVLGKIHSYADTSRHKMVIAINLPRLNSLFKVRTVIFYKCDLIGGVFDCLLRLNSFK